MQAASSHDIINTTTTTNRMELSTQAREVLLSRFGEIRAKDNGYLLPTREGLTYFAAAEVEAYASAVGVMRRNR
tara:strand:+ start:234 stop:455 length:222 start_codon:yes stop_codon:yes gene_type:complete